MAQPATPTDTSIEGRPNVPRSPARECIQAIGIPRVGMHLIWARFPSPWRKEVGMPKQRLVKFEVKPSRRGGWDVAQGTRTVVHVDAKLEAVRRGTALAKQQPAASLRIRKQDGQLQEERTYPRRADPRKSKG